ncbi:hypothetical protein E2C01_024594 [Portunus trituberculatus]|uniref:Uncharacterized protein n=1 Tax=Portunus trituberculatus TaxID=210409 RepID=A0A5B7ECS2_PORTR|nr:hypothetical protein [Portunus trituberculatus]
MNFYSKKGLRTSAQDEVGSTRTVKLREEAMAARRLIRITSSVVLLFLPGEAIHERVSQVIAAVSN